MLGTDNNGFLDDDVPLLDAEGDTFTQNLHHDSPLLIPPSEHVSEHAQSSTDEDESDSTSCDPMDSNVSITMATGISAQWRRSRRKGHRSSAPNLHSTSDLELGLALVASRQSGLGTSLNEDGTSLVSSGAISNDSVVISFNEGSPKVSSSDVTGQNQTTNQTSQNTVSCDVSCDPKEAEESSVNQDDDAPPTMEYSANDHQGSDGEDSLLSNEMPDDIQPLTT